jgi:hypothetical protein
MNKEKTTLIMLLSRAAVAGNILFILWMSYNGINEHFEGVKVTIYQKLSYIGLTGLLIVNSFLILRGKRES